MRVNDPGWWRVVPLLAVCSLGAASREASLVEAVKHADRRGHAHLACSSTKM